MADTGITVFPSAMVANAWAADVITEALKESDISKFIGEDENSVIQKRTELNKIPGQFITFQLRKKMTGDPIVGDESEIAGNEKQLTFHTDKVYIDEMSQGSKKKGRYQDRMSKIKLLDEMKDELRVYFLEELDEIMIRSLSGDTTLALGDVGAWTGLAPTVTTNHLFGGAWDGTNDPDAGDDWLGAYELIRMKQAAKVAGIKPLTLNGKKIYPVFISNEQFEMLKAKDTTLATALQTALPRSFDHPIFTGAAFMYNGLVIHENDHIIDVAGKTACQRALLAGKQAGAFAWGEGPTAGEQLYDHGRKKGISLSYIWGFKKCVFDSKDWGTIVMDTYATALAGVDHTP